MRASFGFLVLASLPLFACGGSSISDSSTGGSAGAGGSGAVAGSGGVAGTGAVAGSGGVAGTGAVAGSGGSAGNECSAELKASANLGGPPVGFEALPGGPGSAVVVVVTQDSLGVSLGPDGGTVTFHWVGPDLTARFKPGDSVSIGNEKGWDFVAGGTYTAATYREFGFVAPDTIPPIPYYGPGLSYAPQCTFHEGSGGCNSPPGTVTVLAVQATTGAGVLAINHGQTQSLVGWDITNVNNVQYPGYSDEMCVVEAGFAGTITAIGPALDLGGG